jgi:hypothetical protein
MIPESHNYPGFHGIGGSELLVRLKEQALTYAAVCVADEVTGLAFPHWLYGALRRRGGVAVPKIHLCTRVKRHALILLSIGDVIPVA